MKAVDCQANKIDFINSQENYTHKIFNVEQENCIKFNKESKIFQLSENNLKLLKNKRSRDPQNLDIAKHTIIRNINVNFSIIIIMLSIYAKILFFMFDF